MTVTRTAYVAFLACLLLLSTDVMYAEKSRSGGSMSMSVIGGDSRAQDCFRSAGIASQIHYATHSEIEDCTYALEFGALSQRDRAATLVNRGIIYMALEEYERAIKDYTAAKKLNPDFGEVYINVGNVFFLGKLYDKAIEEYTAALEKSTTRRHIAYFNRAMAYEKLGDFASAETDYKAVMELRPDWSLPQARLQQLQNRSAGPSTSPSS